MFKLIDFLNWESKKQLIKAGFMEDPLHVFAREYAKNIYAMITPPRRNWRSLRNPTSAHLSMETLRKAAKT